MDKATLLKKKICLLGSFAVGKTSLIERFVYDRFDEKYLTTIGVKISQKILPPIHDHRSSQMIQHSFLIWDIAGLEKFDRMVKNYFRGAAAALAVADLTRPDTIGDLRDLCDKFLAVNPDASLVVLGNKLDIFHDNQDTLVELEKTAAHYATDFRLTSAKTGEHVERAFIVLSQKIGSSP
jgi:small GTP-binding protein